jgi:osmotically-inducible protein OsmY
MLGLAVDVPPNTVEANVRDNMITLSGTVIWQFQREAAARAVMYLRGITGVTNDILLAATAPAPETKTEIEAAILRNAQLDSREITVALAGGEVTLGGTVRSWAERRQAEYVAWSARGVTSLKNHLAITS